MTYNLEDKPLTRVAVIGAGSSGLAHLQQLQEAWARDGVKSKLELVGFEGNEDVGGVWLADEEPKRSLTTHLPGEGGKAEEVYSYAYESENPSPMYQGMRTNIPSTLMAYRGFEFPMDTDLFPKRAIIHKYLSDFADEYNLRPFIRFNTRVERVFLTPSSSADPKPRRWTIESTTGGERRREEFDFVSVSNGHYSDGWIPNIRGLSSFPGEIIHSRFYRSASDLAGKTVLIVGSFASGGDISRLVGAFNVGKYTPTGEPIADAPPEEFIKLFVSSSGATLHSPDPAAPWGAFIHNRPLIDYVETPSAAHPKGVVHFQGEAEGGEDAAPLGDVDIILFATGYNFSYPFFRASDLPWKETSLVDGVIRKGEREGGEKWEEGGTKGLVVEHLDELLMFLENDRTMSFLTLPYQMVPFPLSQAQARLASLLWASLLPSFPDHPALPPNPSNPYSSQTGPTPSDPPASGTETPSGPGTPALATQPFTSPGAVETPSAPAVRKMLAARRHLLFGAPYEWTYSEFLMGLMAEADKGKEGEVPDHWKKVEGWRRELRAQTDLRKKTLGY
ncbi:hypothetical protein IAT38_005563 [Cryptococcus sp. DSM 104549]